MTMSSHCPLTNGANSAVFPLKEKEYRKFLGVPKLFGERGFTPVEQRSARPTLEIKRSDQRLPGRR
jgi:hypothetical protein